MDLGFAQHESEWIIMGLSPEKCMNIQRCAGEKREWWAGKYRGKRVIGEVKYGVLCCSGFGLERPCLENVGEIQKKKKD